MASSLVKPKDVLAIGTVIADCSYYSFGSGRDLEEVLVI